MSRIVVVILNTGSDLNHDPPGSAVSSIATLVTMGVPSRYENTRVSSKSWQSHIHDQFS